MTLDELLLEWSYRSEKGYPSLDSPSDISILKQILEKLDIPSHTIIKNLKEGRGIQLWPIGSRYEGFWRNNMADGF